MKKDIQEHVWYQRQKIMDLQMYILLRQNALKRMERQHILRIIKKQAYAIFLVVTVLH